jgi:hypothetical protein
LSICHKKEITLGKGKFSALVFLHLMIYYRSHSAKE